MNMTDFMPSKEEATKHIAALFPGAKVNNAEFLDGEGFEYEYDNGNPLGWIHYDKDAANYKWTVGRFEYNSGNFDMPGEWFDIEVGKMDSYWRALGMLANELAEIRIDETIQALMESGMEDIANEM